MAFVLFFHRLFGIVRVGETTVCVTMKYDRFQ